MSESCGACTMTHDESLYPGCDSGGTSGSGAGAGATGEGGLRCPPTHAGFGFMPDWHMPRQHPPPVAAADHCHTPQVPSVQQSASHWAAPADSPSKSSPSHCTPEAFLKA
jgi:hypothetical protein